MSINRLLSRRDKSRPKRELSSNSHTHFRGSFTANDSSDGEHERAKSPDGAKVKEIQDLLCKAQVGTFSKDDVKYALTLPYTNSDRDKTVEFLKFLQDSQDLLVMNYDPKVKLLGAVNRNMTTCYLDSLLFAMFGCQDSYEPMLVNRFRDKTKDRLATLLRLWVNTQRAGKLITTDITKQIQDALADCGWREAAEAKQQDAGEAFTIITAQLGLPNLYLKMDLFHHGKEDAKDDHKIVQERLLEMPVPDPTDERSVVTLEDCAEAALNAKVEVRRFLEERQRRDTASSTKSADSSKASAVHVESVEVPGSEPSTPTVMPADTPATPFEQPKRPLTMQHRAPSIIKENIVGDNTKGDSEKGTTRPRAGTIRKEVMIPAWQMYSLIPFHTGYSPENDAQVAAHFKLKQPIFGIRLKRYGFTEDGKPVRKQTQVDIPLDMAFPSFIRDEEPGVDTNKLGKFKLALQSVVCHRGISTESGHYVSLARGRNPENEERWYIWDDLAQARVSEIDITEALKQETPYLLFYQVQPLEEVGKSHSESISSADKDSGVAGISAKSSMDQRLGSESGRPSFDEASWEDYRSKLADDRRGSIALTDESAGYNDEVQKRGHQHSTSLTVESAERPSRRLSKPEKPSSKSRSRPTSSNGSKRLSTSLTRLTGGRSSETVDRTLGVSSQPSKPGANTMAEIVIAAQEKEKVKLKKKEEKSKNRLSMQFKQKHSKAPDRECSMM